MNADMQKVLVLDNGFVPIDIITAGRAFTLLYQGKAREVPGISSYCLRSKNISFEVPTIIYVDASGRKTKKLKAPSAGQIHTRDNFTCQYCNTKLHRSELTLDHVHPRSRGGENTWQNLVTACQSCNAKKGDLLLSQIPGMRLLRTPKRPNYADDIMQHATGQAIQDWKLILGGLVS